MEAMLKNRFGWSEFLPGQRQAIEALTTQGKALIVFPTGGGKSLCYQLPALMFDGLTVVVSPLIALMKDQIDMLTARGISAGRLDSSLSASEARAVADRIRTGTLKLLYVSPERFANERFLDMLSRTKIALFAVDEAHSISEWGHNFRPDYLKLAGTARAIRVERILALTATATPAVVKDICERFEIPPECAVVTGVYRPNLRIRTVAMRANERDAALLHALRTRPAGTTIVYVTLQKTAEAVAAFLERAGLPTRAYHAGMETDERTATQEWWMTVPGAIVVATIAFGMGIDKANVRYVYHYNLPKSLESYSQEIGRAGRDGASSTVEMLAALDDVVTLQNFAYGDTPSEQAVRGVVEAVLGAEQRFTVKLHDLSTHHDIRLLVLRTLLTYLELNGVIQQSTPVYGSYKVKPLGLSPAEIAAKFVGERGEFITNLFRHAQRGATWYTMDADTIAATLGQERQRIVHALDYLAEKELIELQASDVRYPFQRIADHANADALVADLMARFISHERREIERLQQVIDLVERDGCQANALAAHFGEQRQTPCGHCTWCTGGVAQRLLPPVPPPPIGALVSRAAVRTLREAHPQAVGEPRQLARMLCGITSPRLTAARLARHQLFGTLSGHRFADVLMWCESVT